MKIAIVGSRDFKDMDLIGETIDSNCGYDVSFITGGARGVDREVEKWCVNRRIPCRVITPIDPKDKLSYLYRNVEIVTLADVVIAFWDGESKGTKFVIDYARARRKFVRVVKC